MGERKREDREREREKKEKLLLRGRCCENGSGPATGQRKRLRGTTSGATRTYACTRTCHVVYMPRARGDLAHVYNPVAEKRRATPSRFALRNGTRECFMIRHMSVNNSVHIG